MKVCNVDRMITGPRGRGPDRQVPVLPAGAQLRARRQALRRPLPGVQAGEEEAGERRQVVPSPADVPAVRKDPLQQAVPRQSPQGRPNFRWTAD